MSSRNAMLEITKTRQGSRICLEVPQRKLGAVLGAIGAALDGHPWAPYRVPKARTRGRRGGSNTGKLAGNGAVPLGASSRASSATKRSGLGPDDVACPKIPPTHEDPSHQQTHAAPSGAARGKQQAAHKRAPDAAHEARPSNPSSGFNTSNGFTTGSGSAPNGGSSTAPSTSESTAPQCDFSSLVSEENIAQTKRIGALRRILSDSKRPVWAARHVKVPPKPKSEDYGGLLFSKPIAQWAKDLKNYQDAVKQNNAAFEDNDRLREAQAHNKLISGDHFTVCDTSCGCDARHNPYYLTLLAAYQEKVGGNEQVVKRQRQPRGTGRAPRSAG